MPVERSGLNYAVFTDLDGTLLDHDTYSWKPAAEALALCKRLDVPVVMVSSKTRAEMEVLRSALDLEWPFISENGGGIAFPGSCPQPPPLEARPEGGEHVLRLGVPYEFVSRALREIREELNRPEVRGFSEMDVKEIALLTGLPEEDAERAAAREYDEPFVAGDLPSADLDLICRAADKRGLKVTAGGRFFHIFGGCDKGEAVSLLLKWFGLERPRLYSVGLGDSANDLPMLKRVDVPVLVRSPKPVNDLAAQVRGVRITREAGPTGWNRAILELFDNHVNGRVGSQD